MKRQAILLFMVSWAVRLPAAGLPLLQADVAVYGGTSGGVIAAVQAARAGLRTVLVATEDHLGGMSSNGLGVTDKWTDASIAGMSREFYRRVGQKYGQALVWWFEPHVAEEVFEDMIAEAGVTVLRGEWLEGVEKSGNRLTLLRLESGRAVAAQMFIDTTYEGDLLAAAGISWRSGREANAEYSETLNGVKTPTAWTLAVDPWRVPGDPASGPCFGITTLTTATAGSADGEIQSYNFRLCLTNVAANRIPIAPPPDYDAGKYELLARMIEARVAAGQTLKLGDFIDIQMVNGKPILPNGKTDINANGVFSTDYAGANAGWIAGNRAQRQAIADEHERFIRGLFHFLGSDARVPAAVRAEAAGWGLAADEFPDNAHWPRQLYVREARRMAGSYVMTERDAMGSTPAPDPIGLASYPLDSHTVQRTIRNGRPANEGGFFVAPPQPYPIAYGAIVPRQEECGNLFATFALSATHAAFASLRMEPVFMITSQSAALAAAQAIGEGRDVQEIDRRILDRRLRAEGQLLEWNAPPAGGIVTDSEDPAVATVSGAWTVSTAITGFQGKNYLFDAAPATAAKSVRFRPDLPEAGRYRVSLAWRFNPGRATHVPLTLTHAGGVESLTVNQNVNGGTWFPLGTWDFAAGTSGSLLLENAGADGSVVADAVLWERWPAAVSVFAVDPVAAESGHAGRFLFLSASPAPVPLVLSWQLGGTAHDGTDFTLPGTATIQAGQTSVQISLTPLADALPEGAETVTLTLTPPADGGWQAGPDATAAITLRDDPWDGWRAAHFAGDDPLSGPTADPDGDGLVNLVEFATAGDPHQPGDGPLTASGDVLTLRLNPDAPPGTLALEESADLQTWAPATGLAVVSVAGESVRLRWLPGAGRRFFRVRATQ